MHALWTARAFEARSSSGESEASADPHCDGKRRHAVLGHLLMSGTIDVVKLGLEAYREVPVMVEELHASDGVETQSTRTELPVLNAVVIMAGAKAPVHAEGVSESGLDVVAQNG